MCKKKVLDISLDQNVDFLLSSDVLKTKENLKPV